MINRSNVTSFTVVPKGVSLCSRNESKKYTFDNVVFEFSSAFGRRTDPGDNQMYGNLKNSLSYQFPGRHKMSFDHSSPLHFEYGDGGRMITRVAPIKRAQT